jgi:hypothetical protein
MEYRTNLSFAIVGCGSVGKKTFGGEKELFLEEFGLDSVPQA